MTIEYGFYIGWHHSGSGGEDRPVCPPQKFQDTVILCHHVSNGGPFDTSNNLTVYASAEHVQGDLCTRNPELAVYNPCSDTVESLQSITAIPGDKAQFCCTGI